MYMCIYIYMYIYIIHVYIYIYIERERYRYIQKITRALAALIFLLRAGRADVGLSHRAPSCRGVLGSGNPGRGQMLAQ